MLDYFEISCKSQVAQPVSQVMQLKGMLLYYIIFEALRLFTTFFNGLII